MYLHENKGAIASLHKIIDLGVFAQITIYLIFLMKVAKILNKFCIFMKNYVYLFIETTESSKNIKYED